MKPIVITEEQVFNYIRCPLHYDTVYNKKIVLEKEKTFYGLLKKLATKFLTLLSSGKVMTSSSLKSAWDKIYEQNQDVIPQNRMLEGLDLLMKMYRWAEKVELRVVDQKIPYSIGIDSRIGRIDFRGHIDCVAADKDNDLYLLVLDFGNRMPNQTFLDMKVKFSLDSLALNRVYNKWAGIKVHYVKGDKDFYTVRKQEDYNRVETAISNIAYSIQQNIFYPRESVFCSSCDMSNFCRAWP